MDEMTITEDELNRMRKEEKVHISTSKHLFKKTIEEGIKAIKMTTASTLKFIDKIKKEIEENDNSQA